LRLQPRSSAQLGEAALADWKKGSGEEVCER
jgi:hypothetical protein